MITGQKKADTVRKVGDYVGARLNGANKMESAIQASYSPATARNPSLIESTKAYHHIVEKVLTNSANIMMLLTDSILEDMRSDKLQALKPIEKAQIHKIVSDSADKLTPKVTLKQSTDKNGNVTRTAWAQNASQVQEVLADDGEVEG